ncbi:amidase [Schlegelella sp. S2-27]|uniref:Amidase n=1 Tax=Caldimonas mangrovi TaxID=2944811 RepID=A0ABT0YUN0_9BURK|nr:amidase [Caldimonas mangrovi]MCM5682455.1 amidase [Caldimonas mangrovi]
MSNGPTAGQQLAALRQHRTTSAALVDDAIARIEAGASLNAVVVRDFERARRDARAADARRAAGEDAPLLGLPVTVKECFDVAGLPTTWGLPGAHAAAAADAVVVQRLRAAGAVLLGKTNIATMLADWQSSNPVYGTTSNPWNPQRTPGGSSGGGAAAIAARLSALDIGSDLAGSLRLPAAFCGVCSHRPSHGLVPLRGSAPPTAPRSPLVPVIDLATAGPIARSAEDLSLALGVVAGPDAADAVAWRLALPPPRHRVWREHRVLVLDTHPLYPTARDITQAVDRVAQALQAEGCRVSRDLRAVPDLADLSRTFQGLLMSFIGADMPEDRYREAVRRADSGDATTRGLAMSHRDWVWLDRHRAQLAAAWHRTFVEWDVVLCPAAPVTAFVHDDRPMEQRSIDVDGQTLPYGSLSCWAGISQPAGLPVTTVPVGLDRDGLPIGLQVIGPRLEDRTPLAFAAGLQARVQMPGPPPLAGVAAASAPA